MSNILNPEKFLLFAGAFSVTIGILGMFSLGPTVEHSAFGSFLWMDPRENLFHTSLGLIAIFIVLTPGLNSILRPYYKHVVFLGGSIALFFSFFGFLVANNAVPNTFGLTNLEHPADNVLHLVLGIWAFAAVIVGRKD